MVSYAQRVIDKLKIVGESFTLDGVTRYGVFRPLDSGTMRTYLDDIEVMAVPRPGLFLVTGSDTPIVVDDTVTRDGTTYTVKRVFHHTVAGETALTTAVLSA